MQIYIAHYVIEHGSIGLEEEDWVLKETEKPDGITLSEDSIEKKEASIHRLKVSSNPSFHTPNIVESNDVRFFLPHQSMAVELSEVKKELDAITWNMNHLTAKMGMIQNKIRVLDVEMAHILEKRDKSYERIKMLRRQRDKGVRSLSLC